MIFDEFHFPFGYLWIKSKSRDQLLENAHCLLTSFGAKFSNMSGSLQQSS
jgi:hypothetical protein